MNSGNLDVSGLSVSYRSAAKGSFALDNVGFTVRRGECLALVGESGSGKSITGLSIMRLIQEPPGEIVAGEVLYDGRNLLQLTQREMQHIRGKEIAMIFQDPMTSLNPVLTISRQIGEAIRRHLGVSRAQARERVVELLEHVGIPNARERLDQYPHQFSGGMRQRVVIAMALSCNPRLVIADEPTTALDVTIQAQILDLLRRLQKESGMGMVMITHSMGVVAGVASWAFIRLLAWSEDTFPKLPGNEYTQNMIGMLLIGVLGYAFFAFTVVGALGVPWETALAAVVVEELANGNTPQASIRAGYDKAFSTIADANVTTLIAAFVLFLFGSGPVKGFAVTLSLGIITSMFTAIMGTRALVNLYYGRRARVEKLAI